MTQEEKAKAYDEALKRAKAAIDIAADKDLVKGVAITIFPELRESEDERIRKEILEDIRNVKAISSEEYRKKADRWIAWLEKQKEQKPAEDWKEKRKKECPFRRNLDNNLYGCERYADVVSACDGNCSWVVDYPKLKEIQDKKEQKPYEPKNWPADKNNLTQEQKPELPFDELTPEEKMNHPLYLEGFDVGRAVQKVFDEQKPTEWSEEDRRKLNRIYEILGHAADDKGFLTSKRIIGDKEAIELQDFLKSLRPQPKAELTLLDENIIKAAVAFVEQNDHFNCWGGIDKHTVIKALHSPQPHWKPSEEQMQALSETIAFAPDTFKPKCTLMTLQNDLKKL